MNYLLGRRTELIDYVFWITFIFFTNPGGILQAFGENSGDGGINVTDFLFVVLAGSYVLTYHKFDYVNDVVYDKFKIYLFIFLAFYLVVFGFIVPIFNERPGYSPLFSFIKNRFIIINIFLFVFIYRFYLRSYLLFYKIFIYSSILVLTLFIITIVTGVEILPINEYRRNFTTLRRMFMPSYGLLPVLIPMGVVILVFKFELKYKKQIIIGFFLMFVAYVLSITRRFIFGTFIVYFLGVILNSFILKKSLFSIKKVLKAVLFSGIIFFGLYFSFPKYVDAGVLAFEETVHIFKYGETSSGKKDERLGFSRKFIVDIIKEHPFFGTGFDNRWRTAEGDIEGYEAADYPLLSAIAMTGIFGILFFLPIYIVLVRALIYDLKFLRRHKFNFQSFENFLLISFILFFIYDLLQYINWFYGIAKGSDYMTWYFILALYVATRKVFYNNYTINQVILKNE